MFLRRICQRRNGQTYTYYALSETVRSPGGRVRQRTICYLGRLDNLRPPDWLRVAERLPDPAWLPRLMQEVGYVPPDSPGGPVPGVCIDPRSIAWRNPRRLGDVYIGLRAWQLLGLDELLQRRLGRSRTRVPLATVAALIAVNRLVDPRSERGIFHWLPDTALPEDSSGLHSLTHALGEFLLDIRPAENMLVLKTPPSGAQPLAAAVDGAKFGEIAGTVAGDDTVLIVTSDRKSRESLQKKIESLVSRPLRGRG